MSCGKSKIPRSSRSNSCVDGTDVRRGPWTLEEDNLLIHYITSHGEGQWNTLAKRAGLNRTGKSCRLRWLNYLKPDIKRGNLTPHEQILILELHSRWGNRWSKIAQHLPGRTDNEIKNYWRTRVQKQARQLKVDSNSNKFVEAVRMYWMPRLLEKIEQNSSLPTSSPSSPSMETQNLTPPNHLSISSSAKQTHVLNNFDSLKINPADQFLTAPAPQSCGKNKISPDQHDCYHVEIPRYDVQEYLGVSECHVGDADWFGHEFGTSFWNSTDELW